MAAADKKGRKLNKILRKVHRVLLIDDDPIFSGAAVEALRDALPSVKVFHTKTWDGVHALAEFDAVLMDYRLVGVSGFDCLAEIREKLPDLPVLMITGYSDDDELAEEAMVRGADDFVPKNLFMALIPHVLWSAIARRESRRKIENEVAEKLRDIEDIHQKIRPKTNG